VGGYYREEIRVSSSLPGRTTTFEYIHLKLNCSDNKTSRRSKKALFACYSSATTRKKEVTVNRKLEVRGSDAPGSG
jgi:hypothetical protein